MSATLTKGTTFVAGGTVSATNLHALVESMTIAGIDRFNVNRAQVTPITHDSVAPSSPVEKELWQNSTTFIIVAYDATNMRWMPTIPSCRSVQLDATSASASAGSVLVGTAVSGVVKVSDSADQNKVVGIAAIPFAAGEYGVMVVHGVTRVLTSGTVNAGEALSTSSSAGLAKAKGAAGTGYGVAVFAKALRAASGGSTWVNLKW